MGRIALEERKISTKPQNQESLTGLIDSNGDRLKCPSFADLRIKIPFGGADYNKQKATTKGEKSSEFYQRIKTKLTEFYDSLRLKLMEITKYTPK